jgi:hypothetical protein
MQTGRIMQERLWLKKGCFADDDDDDTHKSPMEI